MFKAGLFPLKQVAKTKLHNSLISKQSKLASLQTLNRCITTKSTPQLLRTNQYQVTTPQVWIHHQSLNKAPISQCFLKHQSLKQSSQLRKYHNASILNRSQSKRFYSQGRNRPFPEITYFRINPVTLIFGTFLSIGFFILIIPIIFHLMVPLIICGIIFFQFNKWRRGLFYQQLVRILPRSDILIPYRTVNLLQYSFLPERMLMMKEFVKDMSKFGKFENNIKSKTEAIDFIKFVETRIMESLATNENGIRSYLVSNSSKFRWFQKLQNSPEFSLKLETLSFKTYGQKFGQSNDIMLSIQYPLKLILKNGNKSKTDNIQQIYLGTVTLTVLDDSFSKGSKPGFTLLSDLAKTDSKCNLVISIIPVSSIARPIPKQFIISTWGDSGNTYRNYHTSKTKDGHTEYTVRD
ncbi:MIOREX complex component 9 [Monosporozyma servazzii]